MIKNIIGVISLIASLISIYQFFQIDIPITTPGPIPPKISFEWVGWLLAIPIFISLGIFFLKKDNLSDTNKVDTFLGQFILFVSAAIYAYCGFFLTIGKITPSHFLFFFLVIIITSFAGIKLLYEIDENLLKYPSIIYCIVTLLFLTTLMINGLLFKDNTIYYYIMTILFTLFGLGYFWELHKLSKSEDSLFEFILV